jgi:protein-S-isoprenylcysteine O-methyltransferase Ste14
MKHASAILGSMIFLVVAPGTLAVYLPWTFCHWRFAPPLLGVFSFRILGALMITAGLPILLDSFVRFAIQGLGTPAPVAPPQHLVVTGLYRYVRNPMYVAVSLLIFGQGLLFGNVRLLEYGLIVWLGFVSFVVLYEEPALGRKFGLEYEQFRAHVPRWIPRLKPFEPPS